MQRILLAAALVVGVLIAYVDSLPKWDDTGITVFALVFCAGILGLIVRRRPGLYGLAVGLWLPLRAIILTHDLRFVVVLAFPLAGVYAGWGLHKLIAKTPPLS
ncbi:MAG: hypothetical protein ABSG19_11690 [Candidatus Aminicenantales bacterium]